MVAERLQRSGVDSAAIHGNKSQSACQRALGSFKSGSIRVLVATDLAARGIDIDGVNHVFNFDLPNEPESYVHRIGSTGRAGASGVAVSFCSSSEREDLRAIEKLIGQKVPVVGGRSTASPAPMVEKVGQRSKAAPPVRSRDNAGPRADRRRSSEAVLDSQPRREGQPSSGQLRSPVRPAEQPVNSGENRGVRGTGKKRPAAQRPR